MNLIKCPSCEADVSPNAKTCPKCGSPVKRKWGFWKKFGVFWVVLIVIAMLAKLGGNGDDNASPAVGSNATAQESSLTPSFSVSADDIAQEYDSNEVRADQKFKGKWVEIHGTIKHVGKDITDDPYIVLEGVGMRDVQCTFRKSDEGKLANLNEGADVTVDTRITGLMMNVQGERSVLK